MSQVSMNNKPVRPWRDLRMAMSVLWFTVAAPTMFLQVVWFEVESA